MKKLLASLIFFIGLLLPLAVRADSITDFKSTVAVSRDNVLDVTETITYDPEDGSHHGIERYVPKQFGDPQGNTYYTQIKLLGVTADAGASAKVLKHDRSRLLYLRIGDADKLIFGPHSYTIHYLLWPLAMRAGDHDRLILNVTGQDWRTGIAASSLELKLAAKVISAQCFTGATGSTASDCQASVNGDTVQASLTKPLEPKQGWTIDVNLPPNSFATYLQPNQPPPLTWLDYLRFGLIGATALALLIGLGLMIGRTFQGFIDRRRQTVIPQYESPDGLKPGELGVLIDNRAELAEITATLIDLAVRGYLKIVQTKPKSWWHKAEYRFDKLKSADQKLNAYERKLCDALFSSGDAVEMKKLNKIEMGKAVSEVKQDLGERLHKKGYYGQSPTSGLGWIKGILWLVGLGLGIGGVFNEDGGIIMLAIALVMAVLALAFSWWRTGITKLGAEEAAKVAGFKWFLSVTEKDRLKFFDAPERTPKLFSKLLPYAIALEVEKEWAAQFRGIDVREATGWYSGAYVAGNFNASDFASGFASDFGGAVGSSFAGSSGGGGAGGGGGGGGGGGW